MSALKGKYPIKIFYQFPVKVTDLSIIAIYSIYVSCKKSDFSIRVFLLPEKDDYSIRIFNFVKDDCTIKVFY